MTQFLGTGSQGPFSTGGLGYVWAKCGVEGQGPLFHYFEASGTVPVCGVRAASAIEWTEPAYVEQMCVVCRGIMTRRMLEEQGKDG